MVKAYNGMVDAFKLILQVDQTSQHITATQLEALITDTATGDLHLLENTMGTSGQVIYLGGITREAGD